MFRNFDDLSHFLSENLHWNLGDFPFEDLTFHYDPAELGLKGEAGTRIHAIRQLRPLAGCQPWGVFFIDFASRRLSVEALREILAALVVKKRTASHAAHQVTFPAGDLLFIVRYGKTEQSGFAFVRFQPKEGKVLPVFQILSGTTEDPTPRLDRIRAILAEHLFWPSNPGDQAAWRNQWAAAFDQQVETPELQKLVHEYYVQKHLSSPPPTEPLKKEELNALLRYLVENQDLLLEKLHRFGLFTLQYLDLAERMTNGKVGFGRVIDHEKVESPESYMKGLPKLCDQVREAHSACQNTYEQLSIGSASASVALHEQFEKQRIILHQLCLEFRFRDEVIDDLAKRFFKWNSSLKSKPDDQDLLKKRAQLELAVWKTHEEHMDAVSEVLNCLREDITLREAIHSSCQEHVSKIAAKLFKVGLSMEELIKAGHSGLRRAIHKFDFTSDLDFFHYSFRWIQNPMKRYIDELPGALSSSEKKLTGKMLRVIDQLILEFGREPKLKEVAEGVSLPVRTIVKILDLAHKADPEKRIRVGDYIPLAKRVESHRELLDEIRANPELLERLTERECLVMTQRLGIGDGVSRTLDEVARHMEVTRERVRQIEAKALRKLQNYKLSKSGLPVSRKPRIPLEVNEPPAVDMAELIRRATLSLDETTAPQKHLK